MVQLISYCHLVKMLRISGESIEFIEILVNFGNLFFKILDLLFIFDQELYCAIRFYFM